MSRENLEVVKQAITALNERDLDRYLACCTQTIQLRTPTAAVAGVYEGPKGIRRFWADLEDASPDFRLDLEHLEAVGENRAFAFLRAAGSGRASGVPMEGATTNVYTFVAGKIDRVEIFLDRQQALEVLGLREAG